MNTGQAQATAPQLSEQSTKPDIDNMNDRVILISRQADGSPQLNDAGNLHNESLYTLINTTSPPQFTTYISLEDYRLKFDHVDKPQEDPVQHHQFGHVNSNGEFEPTQVGLIYLLGIQPKTAAGTGKRGPLGKIYHYHVEFTKDGASVDPDMGIEC